MPTFKTLLNFDTQTQNPEPEPRPRTQTQNPDPEPRPRTQTQNPDRDPSVMKLDLLIFLHFLWIISNLMLYNCALLKTQIIANE